MNSKLPIHIAILVFASTLPGQVQLFATDDWTTNKVWILFTSVSNGMSRTDVEALLGKPKQTHAEVFYYCDPKDAGKPSPGDSGMGPIWIVYSSSNTVVEKRYFGSKENQIYTGK